jgi:uncharacterized protein
MAGMAAVHFPLPVPGRLLQNRLNALDKIARIKAPILFFHGDLDTIVPIDLGRELFNAATAKKEFVTISGAEHNDTYFVGGPEYFNKIRSFIESLPSEQV